MKHVIRIMSTVALVGLLLLAGCPATLVDDYEPNETITDFYNLGTVEGNVPQKSWTATISPAGDDDFFGITAKDPNTLQSPGTAEHFTLTVRMVPPQPPETRNYDLYLYSEAGTGLGSSTNPDSAEETVTVMWDGSVGPDDSSDFRVEVRGVGGESSATPYSLYASLQETSP